MVIIGWHLAAPPALPFGDPRLDLSAVRQHGGLYDLASNFPECRMIDKTPQGRRRNPPAALCDKAGLCRNDIAVVLLGFDQCEFCARCLVTLKRFPVQSPIGVECQHVVRKSNDAARHSVLNFNDGLGHPDSLSSEPRAAIPFSTFKHGRESCAGQPVKRIVRSKDKHAN